MNNPVAIILAAGQGSRFRIMAGDDQDKLLAPCRGLIDIERPVLEHVLINLGDCIERRLVITRPHSFDIIALAHAYDCEVLLLDSTGMGDSLAAAVAASAEASGWLVILGDMPFIAPATLDAVTSAMTEECVAVATGESGYGHPVGFGRKFGLSLQTLRGDQGARRLFSAECVTEVQVTDPGIYRDVDIPANLL
jgi:molybdenum cofactor cytidylyltransferase